MRLRDRIRIEKSSIMKRFLLLRLTITTLLLSSCEKMFEQDNITFPSEGGTISVGTSIFSYSLEISDYDYSMHSTLFRDEETGTITVSLEWLTATMKENGSTITLTAKPNESEKRRTLFVHGMHGDLGGSMRVTQKK